MCLYTLQGYVIFVSIKFTLINSLNYVPLYTCKQDCKCHTHFFRFQLVLYDVRKSRAFGNSHRTGEHTSFNVILGPSSLSEATLTSIEVQDCLRSGSLWFSLFRNYS